MSVNLIGISGRIGSGKDTFAKMIQLAIYNNIFKQRGASHFVPPTQEVLDNLSKSWNYENGVWQIKKFATTLKQIACILIGCTMEQLEDQEFKRSTLGEEWNLNTYDTIGLTGNRPMTIREFLQKLGTEAIRGQIHDNAWVNALFSTYSNGRYFMCDNCGTEDIKEIYKEDTCPICKFKDESNLTMVLSGEVSKWLITDVRFPNEVKAIKDRGGILIRISRGAPEMYREDPTLHPSETALDHYKDWDHYIKNTGTLEQLYDCAKTLVNDLKLS